MIRTSLLLLALSVGGLPAQQEPLASFGLNPVVLEGSHVKITYGDELIIEAPQGKPARIQLTKITSPLISQPVYEISGEFGYNNVGGEGYLEMWNDFGDHGRFFTRTLATSGPMAHIVGRSGATPRIFSLPFDTMGKTSNPKSLEINLILPQGGNVGFMKGIVQLKEFPSMSAWGAQYTSSENQSPLKLPVYRISIFASLLGLLGVTTGLLALRSPRLASAGAWTGFGLGIALLAMGMAAPLFNQPFSISYTFLAGGVLVTILFTGLLWYVSRLRQKHELRRMAAMDLG